MRRPGRLADPHRSIEFERTKEIILRRLPAPPAVVADVGGGPGRYTFSAYTHRPAQLRSELGAAGLDVLDLVCVEGPSYLLADLGERLADEEGLTRPVLAGLDARQRRELTAFLRGHGDHWVVTGPCLDGDWYATPRYDRGGPRLLAPSLAALHGKVCQHDRPLPVSRAGRVLTLIGRGPAARLRHGVRRGGFDGCRARRRCRAVASPDGH